MADDGLMMEAIDANNEAYDRMKLSIGDIVQLKSGGMEMVVCGVTQRSVECMWHTTDGFLQCTSIAMGCLVLVKR